MKHIFILYIIFFTCLTSFFSQDRLEGKVDTTAQEYAKNSIYLELAGKGFYYSINFEKKLFNLGEKTRVKASIGFSVFPGLTQIKKSKDFTMPLSISIHQHLKKNHHISLSTGSTYFNYQINDIEISNSNILSQPLTTRLKTIEEWFGHISLDYIFNNPEGGIMIKTGITPLFFDKMQNFKKMKTTQFSANLSVGYTF